MSTKDSGGPAFPGEKPMRFGLPSDCNEGMNLRDYFAAKAISGVIATGAWEPAALAQEAYAIADAMLAERAK